MKNIKSIIIIMIFTLAIVSCDKEEVDYNEETLSASVSSNAEFQEDFLNQIWVQEDQVARPAINTVFTPSMKKDLFNVTVPSAQADEFADDFLMTLNALNPGYTTNVLGLTAEQFTGFLATDVLNVSLTRPTTFFQSLDLLLTGRTLSDDVIDVELLLIFGGPDLTQNPGLTSDNVAGNDKDFLNSFPYLAEPHLN